MPHTSRYTATLRCNTWHSWPEKTRFGSKGLRVTFSGGREATIGVAIATYHGRSAPDDYTPERSDLGPLLWRGHVPRVYVVHDTVMKAPEDTIEIACEHESPRRGEIDILVEMDLPGELPSEVPDTLKTIAFAFLALVNLRLKDHLIPSAPVQVSQKGDAGRQFTNELLVRVEARQTLSEGQVESVTGDFFALLSDPQSAKIQTALELYGAHATEPSIKTRFLLFVMALETLTVTTPKHAVALAIVDRWQQEVDAEKDNYTEGSEEHAALDALKRELLFRRFESIRSQVRHLLVRVAASEPTRWKQLPKRGLRVYDKRSVLVHEGSLPASELDELEAEAKLIAEAAILFSVSQVRSRV